MNPNEDDTEPKLDSDASNPSVAVEGETELTIRSDVESLIRTAGAWAGKMKKSIKQWQEGSGGKDWYKSDCLEVATKHRFLEEGLEEMKDNCTKFQASDLSGAQLIQHCLTFGHGLSGIANRASDAGDTALRIGGQDECSAVPAIHCLSTTANLIVSNNCICSGITQMLGGEEMAKYVAESYARLRRKERASSPELASSQHE